ncbi:hypothetical protein MED01_007047 [Micromonospora sp. MED01]|uniref:hypothetical protein n=1 Tax=Micromonospora alfalfae TaxID=2911212 RepID=UPI001EE91533|nr:hypothetical protein [Micromonospora alfalfae]MCG5462169.1 hypothetical protein [Micromonospora alfalfae]
MTAPDAPDTVAAAELVIAVLDGRPVVPLIDPQRAGSLISGLLCLIADLGEHITGPAGAAQFRALLADYQARQRLAGIFAPTD